MSLIHILDRENDDIIGTLSPEDAEYSEPRRKDSLSNENKFDFRANAKLDKAGLLAMRNKLVIKDEDGFFREYIIIYSETKRGKKIVRSNESFMDLSKAKVIEPQTLTGATSTTAAQLALDGTGWQIGTIEYAGTQTITIERFTNPLAFLSLIASTFDLEVKFYIKISGNKIVGRYVDLRKQIAGFEGKEIEHGKDLSGLVRKEDSNGIVTALLVVGPKRDDGTHLTVLVEDKEALQRWGSIKQNKQKQHLIEPYEPQLSDNTVDENTLRTLGETELKKRVNAIASYEGSAESIEHIFGYEHEKIRIGQTVRIKDIEYQPPLYLEARIQDVERDLITGRLISFTIGNFIEFKKEDLEKQVAFLKQLIAQKASLVYADNKASEAVQTAVNQSETRLQEYTYSKVNVDDKDSGVYQDSTLYTDQRATQVEQNVKTAVENGEVALPASALAGAIKLATSTLQNADSSVFTDENGNFYFIDPDNPDLVTKLTSKGLGISETGINGPFLTAVTGAGINAALITVGKMLFDYLEGGTLTLGGTKNGRLILLNANGETIADLDAGGNGGFADLFIGNVKSPSIINVNTKILNFYIDPINGDDNNTGESFTFALKTIQAALERCPKYNMGTINIYLHYENSRNMYEQISISGFIGSGNIIIDAQTTLNTLTGDISVFGSSNYVSVRNMTINSVNGKGVETVRSAYVYVENVIVYGQNGGRCFYAENSAELHLKNCKGWDAAIIIYARTMGKILIENCSGYGTVRGIAAQTGSQLRLAGTYPGGATSDTYVDPGSDIIGTGTVSSGSKGTVPTQQYTKQIYTNSGDNWSDVYSRWHGDGVRQGAYGSNGNRRGLWFFGTSILDQIGTGKTIKAMRVWIQRANESGASGPVRHSLRSHGYTTKPAGQPSLSNEIGYIYLERNKGNWINVDSAFWNYFATGASKGFGIYTDDGSNYSQCTTECWVEITYQ